MITKRTCGLPLICLICGDVARGINFNVMTCMSCKTFFRRHVLTRRAPLVCQRSNNCTINKETRGNCSACRLNKCFQLGMVQKSTRRRLTDKLMFNHDQYLPLIHGNQYPLPQPVPINLLRNDSSDLTTDEWNLLSNVIHAYEATDKTSEIKYFFQNQSSLPLKIRLNPTKAMNTFKAFLSTIQPFIESSPLFQSLSTRTRQMLLENNSEIAGTFNSVLIMRKINALNSGTFLTSCATVYGQSIVEYIIKALDRLEANEALIKVMVLILLFSTNCSIVTMGHSKLNSNYLMTSSIFSIENILVTMLWKYLNYLYGHNMAVRCFSSLIKYIINLIQCAAIFRCSEHEEMVDALIEETKRLLTNENSNTITNTPASASCSAPF